MQPVIALIVLIIIVGPIALAIWLTRRANSAKQEIEELSRRLGQLESVVTRLKRDTELPKRVETAPASSVASEVFAPVQIVPAPPYIAPPMNLPSRPPAVTPLPAFITPRPQEPAPIPPVNAKPPINWEQFMGVKGFAWGGGLALFLGVAFFVKYSFDNNLVPPALRVAIGFLTGLGLLVGGVLMSRKNFPALSQTLCATGVVILYAVSFACHAVYHFQLFGPIPTFLLMALITATAFFLAVRLNAFVVAILGMLGGFLTPILLSTGQDNPLALFGYVAILDIGLIFVALNRRWYFLTALAAAGTTILQVGWADKFFVTEKYFQGNKILVVLGVFLGFIALFLAGAWSSNMRKPARMNRWLAGSALGLVASALLSIPWLLDFAALANRPWLMFGFVFLVDLASIALVLLDETLSPAESVSGVAVFGLLGLWTVNHLSNGLLNAALAFYFIFAVVHSALPIVLQRRGGAAKQNWVLFPVLALVLVLVPVLKLPEGSFIVWPFILLVDALAIGLAVLTVTLLPVLVVLLLTLAATGTLIFKIPADLTGLPLSLFLLGGFAVFFVAASIWLVKKFNPGALKTGIGSTSDFSAPGDIAAILPICSIVLPFLLLIMATLRLQLTDPSPVFGLAMLLVVLLLGLTKLCSLDWMPAIGLACVTALEFAWHSNHFGPTHLDHVPLNLVLTWYLIFFAAFAVFPFLFLKQFSGKTVPWAAAAMAGLPQFYLIHSFVSAVHPYQMMGLLPAAFAVPGLLSLVVILKKIPAEAESRMTQLAWFGGVSLFFITLIFPIQFERQWITIGWALEGAALLWLFHRVPHRGLRFTGILLLAAAFVRLSLNSAVLEYHQRAATPIFNWYLYAYGIVAICLFVGAKLLAPPRNLFLDSNVPPILAGMGAALAFLLLNIEIADYFSKPGSMLQFQWGGNFAREMTYTIAWAVFALVLLIYGIIKASSGARYSAMGLLSVTLLKLFFHDLANLGQLYRIAAFVAVAVIAMVASFAYQKFFTAVDKQTGTKDEATK